MNLKSTLFVVLRRPVAVWLAAWVTVLAALVPTGTHAMELLTGGSNAPDICSAANPLSVRSDASPDQTPSPEHCALCVLALERLAPPPADCPALAPAQAGHEISRRPGWASVIARRVLLPAPRGPPRTS